MYCRRAIAFCVWFTLATLLPACSKKSTSSPSAPSRSNAQPTASVTFTPQGTAIMRVTSLTFSGTGSDADGDPLTYNWNFGDGTTGTGQSVAHVFPNEGTFSVVLTVSDGKGGSGTATASVKVGSVNGIWRSEARAWNLELRQSGSTITGKVLGFKGVTYADSVPGRDINGTIQPPKAVEFNAAIFGIGFSGTASTDITPINGTLSDCANGCRNYGEMLTKQ